MQKTWTGRQPKHYYIKNEHVPKKGTISKRIFMGYSWVFLGEWLHQNFSNAFGPVHRKSCRSSGGSRGGAVAKASATVADPTVRAATGGFCNAGIGSTWGEEHLEKKGKKNRNCLCWFFALFLGGWNIWQYPSVLQRGLYGRNRLGGWSVELFCVVWLQKWISNQWSINLAAFQGERKCLARMCSSQHMVV